MLNALFISVALFFDVLFKLVLSSKLALTIATSVGSPSTLFPIISQFAHIEPYSNTLFLSPITSTTFMLFSVSVPVLSEHITLLLPSVSTAGNFLIIAFFFAIFVTAIESIIVTIAGKPSGIAATAKPTDVINISVIGIFFIIPITNITAQITKQAIPSTFPTSSNFF